MTGKEEERGIDKSSWKLSLSSKSEEGKYVEKRTKTIIVGAGARVLFYPTLLYNVLRNTFESEFRWWDQVDQFLLLGAVPFPRDVLRLKSIGVKAVVTLNEPFETLVPTSMYKDHNINHLVVPTTDYLFAPSLTDIQRAVDFINDHAQQGQVTYVHCKAGRGRSTTIVLCYLVEHRGMTPVEALHYVRSKRPRVLLAPAQWKAVQEFGKCHEHCLPQKPLLLSASTSVLELPSFNVNSSLMEGCTSCSADSLKGFASDNHSESYFTEDSPVVISSMDLVGYKDGQDSGYESKHWQDSVVCRLRLLAAKNVVGAAKASVTWVRLSALWLGCNPQNEILSDRSSVKCIASAEPASCKKMASNLSGQLAGTRIDVPVCQSGIVNC